MVKISRLLRNSAAGAAGIISGLILYSKFKGQPESHPIPPFFTRKKQYIFAHRGGMALRPELTKLAFDTAQDYEVDGFETDVRVTRDEQLIVFHDAEVDRTTNGSGKVSEHRLDEIQRLDAGYHFKDINNDTPYRNNPDAKVMTFDELLETYPEMLINVDLKDHPDSMEGQIAPELIYESIVSHNAQNRVLVTSFYQEQIRCFNEISLGTVAIGASEEEVTVGLTKFFTGLGNMFEVQANTFQMPTTYHNIPLTSQRLISWLNSRNIVPGYYGVNSIDLMSDLFNKGVHTVVTDRPDLAFQYRQNQVQK
ncbi:glycerophosphodiester phosphodiesterase [Staphylococcus carnosus]|uniref:Glycerophosphoryl diester phosphodiesterase n=1 Tax=Staphylococcus carnosus (strain TM300) TaxID=396513 RepID=B9DPW3_STACT|nr:glycerophosphodiester phosphodiesterase [Staphylococcus carnosus]QPT03824.1 glycerophosphodiester phosphodiesterase [Staphylococcus carnosus]UQA66549.1 glycerophosphodiester phosphodiesterase [Staphylococcus carnosus]UTB78621.1 glycerophosphodiester phosphodiesterase [Staphylococcus carnosus]UTB88170.1 glycerophosphodiester phosphodiesterase [Staphylococcus carnosus]UTB90521.1 glycerophosphodiester phosphodiesterase [Staphylococcus carnosus]